jgi:hypothetical protein
MATFGDEEVRIDEVRIESAAGGRLMVVRKEDDTSLTPAQSAAELLSSLLFATGADDYDALVALCRDDFEGIEMLCPESASAHTKAVCADARREAAAQRTAVSKLDKVRIRLQQGGLDVGGFDAASGGFDHEGYDAALAVVDAHSTTQNFGALAQAAQFVVNEDTKLSGMDTEVVRAAFRYAEVSFSGYRETARACGKARGTTRARTAAIALEAKLREIQAAVKRALSPTAESGRA